MKDNGTVFQTLTELLSLPEANNCLYFEVITKHFLSNDIHVCKMLFKEKDIELEVPTTVLASG